jgi:hypothetical protein
MVGQHQQHHVHASDAQDGKVSPCEAVMEKILSSVLLPVILPWPLRVS